MRNPRHEFHDKQKRPMIGVLCGWQVYERAMLRNYLGPLIRGIRAASQKRGCDLLIACGIGRTITLNFEDDCPVNILPAWPLPSPESDFVPVGPWNTDGLIVVNPLMSAEREQYILKINAEGHPVVFVGTALGGPAIGIDNQGGIRQAINHLFEHGHRSIAFIAGIPNDVSGDSGERLLAYRAALSALGLEENPRLVAYGFHSVEGGRQAMQKIIRSGVACTALVTSSDESAFGAIAVIKEAGLDIPKDIAIIGFDDQPEAVIQEPPLTTIHSLTFERGYRSVELLLDKIKNKPQKDSLIIVPTKLTIRQSCGCQPEKIAPSQNDLLEQAPIEDTQRMLGQIANQMTVAMLTEIRLLDMKSVHDMCLQLTEAYFSSIKAKHFNEFSSILDKVILYSENAGETAHIWETALEVLRSNMPVLIKTWLSDIRREESRILGCERAGDMLHDALLAISKSVQRNHHRYILNQNQSDDSFALFSARILNALDEEQIFDILSEHLPALHIHHAAVVLFESGDGDPVAWSVLHTVRAGEHLCYRFPSHEFPPPGLYPKDENISLALLPLKIDEKQVGYVAFDAANLDIYGQIVYQLAASLKITRLYQQANQGRRLAEEANRMKSRLLSITSHELRTPLNLIVGLSGMMLNKKADTSHTPVSYWQDIERINASAQLLDGLIRDVLDLSRSESGQLNLSCELLNLEEVLSIVSTLGQQLCAEKELVWRVECPASLPRVWGDRTRLRQVILNLISNAVKFTTSGEVALIVRATVSDVSIEIQDTGLGIAPEEQQVIFDEFRQAERTSTRGFGGLGLGLAICKRLVELHGGQIRVSSSGEEGSGSAFSFTLPVVNQFSHQVEKNLPPSSDRPVTLLSTSRESSQPLCDYLLSQGFLVKMYPVEDNTAWLADLLANIPAAVILDVDMASAKGWDVLKMLKSRPETANIPVLFYALTSDENKGSLLDLNYLTKPVELAELAQALERQGLMDNKSGEGEYILIADDDEAILEMHSRIVQMQLPAFRILKAQNGRQALTLIQREKPALVLLDLMMPEMDGFAVLETIQQDDNLRGIPVIVLTGQELNEDDLARLNHGVAKVLRKGLFNASETLAHVEKALTRGRGLAEESQRLARKAMVYMHAHCHEPISRNDVARYVGINSDYLSRLFRQELGVNLITYLNRLRIERAKMLLTAGKTSITEIASLVGFSSASYFWRTFRRETGLSPGDYQRQS